MSTSPGPLATQSQSTAPPQTLAGMIRAKYPGAYSDMDDATLEKNVLAKYPQYSDLPRSSGGPSTQAMAQSIEQGALGGYPQQQALAGMRQRALALPRQPGIFTAGTPTPGSPAAQIQGKPIAQGSPNKLPWLSFTGPTPDVPQGMEAAANVAERTPQIAQAASAIPGADILPWLKGISATAQDAGPVRRALGRVGDFFRDPETGKLKPLVREGVRAGGAATGYETGKESGHGMEGMLLGGFAAPSMADAIVPSSGAFSEARTVKQLESQMNAAEAARQEEITNAEKLRNQDAQARMVRERQQGTLDKQATPQARFGQGGTFSNASNLPPANLPAVAPNAPPAPQFITNMIKPQAPEVDPVAQAVKARTASWIPTKIPQEAAEVDPVAQAVKNRTAAYLPTRIKPQAPEPSPTFGQGATFSNDPSLPRAAIPNVSAAPTPPPAPQFITNMRGTTGAAQQPFEPLVYSSPQEAEQIDFRNKNLKRQASAAGTYHAAQGASGKASNLQQRIARKYPWSPEE